MNVNLHGNHHINERTLNVSLYGWSPVSQFWTQLLHYEIIIILDCLSWSNPILFTWRPLITSPYGECSLSERNSLLLLLFEISKMAKISLVLPRSTRCSFPDFKPLERGAHHRGGGVLFVGPRKSSLRRHSLLRL